MAHLLHGKICQSEAALIIIEGHGAVIHQGLIVIECLACTKTGAHDWKQVCIICHDGQVERGIAGGWSSACKVVGCREAFTHRVGPKLHGTQLAELPHNCKPLINWELNHQTNICKQVNAPCGQRPLQCRKQCRQITACMHTRSDTPPCAT